MKTLAGSTACALVLAFFLAPDASHAETYSFEPAAAALAESLELNLSKAPARDNPSWRKPKRIAVYLPPRVIETQPQLLAELEKLTEGIEVVVMPRDLEGRSELEAVAEGEDEVGGAA